MAFDASPSWSGFNYQGKIALHHALTLINAQPVGFDFSATSLMLESNEDFEIIINDSPISFHQVKAYNSSTFEDYSDALFGLTLELYKRNGVKGHIHTWMKINDRPHYKGLLASVKNDFAKVLKEYQDATPKAGTSILEKAATSETNLPKKAAILKAALPDKNAEYLATVIDEIINLKNDALSRLTCYIYKDGNAYCDLKDINNKIQEEISIALNTRAIPITEEQLKKALDYFLGVIDSYIIERHKNKKSATAKPITFGEIIKALDFDHEDVGKKYTACRFKNRFTLLLDEYLGDEEDYPQPISSEPCNLRAAQKLLLSLPPVELWEHYRNFSPQIILDNENNTDNALSYNDEGIRYYLLKIFHEINFSRLSQDTDRYRFSYKCSSFPPQNYLPTTITNSGKLSQTVRQLNLNPCLSELLYEVHNLIYCGSQIYPFSPDSDKSTEAPHSTAADPRPKREDVLPKITLMPLKTAQDALAK